MSNTAPIGWSYNSLSDLASIDKESLKGSTDPDYKFKYIDIACVSTGQINLPAEHIRFQDSPSRARKRVRRGDVIMSTVRPNLQAFAYFDARGAGYIASTGFSVIRANDKSDGKFLFNTILADDVTSQIDALVVGSNYPAINSSDVKNLEILTPPLPEQQKIATILTSVDNVIEKTETQINKLQALKKGMMQELLTKGVGTNGVPHTEFKDSSVGRIPKGWEVKTIQECCEIMTNGFVGATRDIYRDDGIPYVLCQNVRANSFVEKIYKYIDAEFHKKNKRAALKSGDVLTVQTGAGNGDTCVVPPSFEGANCHALIISRPKKNILNSFYLSEFMNSDYGKKRVSVIATGGAHPHLNTTDLRREVIPLPPIEEQNVIANTLNSIRDKIVASNHKAHHFKCLKKALMQDLLTGKVRVKINQNEKKESIVND